MFLAFMERQLRYNNRAQELVASKTA
jgi:hypothetical protein